MQHLCWGFTEQPEHWGCAASGHVVRLRLCVPPTGSAAVRFGHNVASISTFQAV